VDDSEAPGSVPPLTSMPPVVRGRGPLHAYMVQGHRMRVGAPLTFSDGGRVVAVLSSSPVPGLPSDIDVIVLVELP
jgi:hypothetical protein